jgi:phenylacetic acid degradation operon negative regulatory protein
VLARPPDTDRGARHRLRNQLTWAGFGSPAPGVWVSAHADRADEAAALLAEAGLGDGAHVFAAEHRSGDDAAMAAAAWDLAALQRAYQGFLNDFRAPAAPDTLTRVVELVHAWRRFPWIDPVLPRTLLPSPWAGEQAVSLFTRLHADWTGEATATWHGINSDR